MPTAAPIFRPGGSGPSHRQDTGRRANAYRRGYGGRRWAYLRRATFRRDGYICAACGVLCQKGAADARLRPHCEHIRPRERGGSDGLENLQTLCGSCHSIKTGREQKGGGVK